MVIVIWTENRKISNEWNNSNIKPFVVRRNTELFIRFHYGYLFLTRQTIRFTILRIECEKNHSKQKKATNFRKYFCFFLVVVEYYFGLNLNGMNSSLSANNGCKEEWMNSWISYPIFSKQPWVENISIFT